MQGTTTIDLVIRRCLFCY